MAIPRHCWLSVAFLGLPCLAGRATGRAFQSRSELREAVEAWEAANQSQRQLLAADWGGIATWDVSAVTSMHGLFRDLTRFNEDIGAWNTSSVSDMSYMFANASKFDRSIEDWDTSAVVNMSHMFYYAERFNQPVGRWKTAAVTDMQRVFSYANFFEKPLTDWDTSSVTNMACMFCAAERFNQSLAHFETSAVVNMSFMFAGADAFDQPIGMWNTSSVRDLTSMFAYCATFNQPLARWNTSSVTCMACVFCNARQFNQPIGSWNTGKVTDMSDMFNGASTFDQPLDNWDTSAVTTMQGMFETAAAFNQPIGKWDTSSVTTVKSMFDSAQAFNQPLGTWNVSAVTNFEDMFKGAWSFNQPVGTWQVLNRYGAQQLVWQGGFEECVRSSILRSWRKRWPGIWVAELPPCARCDAESRCPTSDTACVDGVCYPVNSGFIELGSASWDLRPGDETVEAGFRDCARRCTDDLTCAGFFLQSSRCILRTAPGLPVKRGAKGIQSTTSSALDRSLQPPASGPMQAYFKHSCATFSCPFWGTRAAEPGESVSEKSCCSCFPTNLVKDLLAPTLLCVACPAGSIPASNGSACEPCPSGHYATSGKLECDLCPAGSKPSERRDGCRDCGALMFSNVGDEDCTPCKFPFLLGDDLCMWWHLPLIALCLTSFMVAASLLLRMRRRHRSHHLSKEKAMVEDLMRQLEQDLWNEEEGSGVAARYEEELGRHGMESDEAQERITALRKRQSQRAGVSMRYLLSAEFTALAQERTAMENPTFIDMKDHFWLCETNKLAEDVVCPRDGRPGAALTDWLPRRERRQQTHFMSWTWSYALQQVQDALQMMARDADPGAVFFYMCFFVNNQFRFIVEGSVTGSDDLESAFESNLRQTGRMVAILDTWQEPVYLTRVWTVYEQFIAASIQIPVKFFMPRSSTASLQREISLGDPGIREITRALSGVDSAQAEATQKQDEQRVKAKIQETVGFNEVNRHVRAAMVKWIGGAVRDQFHDLLNDAARLHDRATLVRV